MSDSLSQLKWGKESELKARDTYLSRMRCLGHREIECQPCGLTLMPAHSYLAASTDGIIRNHKHHNEDGPGVLEICIMKRVDCL